MTRKPKPVPRGDNPVAGPASKSAQAKAQDDQVMATNSSSIVSKRSVEKLYYPHEPHFFRYFVSKFQRRAPLINRGYWLRLRAIDVLCLTRYPGECAGVKFVDVDFPDLIERKRQTVLGTPELVGMFTGVKEAGGLAAPVVFESEQYVQIGCDLRELGTLRQGLAAAVGDFGECEFIFVAEVSITYMEREGADEVIRWASSVGRAEFVLLEQILPDGDNHPFASTMLGHFDKLNTQLKSVSTYPSVTDQHARFSSRGWDSVNVWTLWQAWADETFLSKSERLQLDEIEQFDEWEEFALFGSHYCVVHARTGSGSAAVLAPSVPSNSEQLPTQSVGMRFDECPGVRGQRRFAAAMRLSRDERDETAQSVLNVLGLGTKSRLQSCDLFRLGTFEDEEAITFHEGGPTTRMCHSLTDLGGGEVLLAGGRGSPSAPLADCWLFNKDTKTWKQTHGLPIALYRHSVAPLGRSGTALLIGGRGATEAFGGCLLYHPVAGWVNCEIVGEKPASVYGAVLSSRGDSPTGIFSGVYAGGLKDALVSDQILSWEADVSDIKKPTIKFNRLSITGGMEQDASWLLTRFGATCLQQGDEFVLLGGVARDHLLCHRDEVLLCSLREGAITITSRLIGKISGEGEPKARPLFTGHSVVLMPDGCVVVIGGGATCFSMGTFWNKGVYTLQIPALEGEQKGVSPSAPRWVHEKMIDIVPSQRRPATTPKPENIVEPAQITAIHRLRLETADDFIKIVVIHEAATQAMDFTAKNFRYVTAEFSNFAQRVEQGDKVYLRALSHEKPSEQPAVLAEDFPALAPDFVLPTQLSLVAENLFSSVLRLSGLVNMWLHYDSPRLAHTHPHEAILSPGDVLFLPPLWLHTATPTSDKSIAVNVFFKDLESDHYASGRDVYGNRDLAAYEKGRQDVARIANSFKKLPAEAREFYLLRLADELRTRASG
ncbi:hypothetical protein B0I37DRAFT_431903 [Chaetomium sp. MPI-CAGE-AT-0009]|nr:hypothetical protein B0I37DRAFT_431903 [Chaetomium sp. MPI-CAGE-AT-0009]